MVEEALSGELEEDEAEEILAEIEEMRSGEAEA
jgi:hypothetical protein